MSKAISQHSIEWMPKNLWGRLKWAELHARCFIDKDMSGEAEWFKSFVTSVPCPKCQEHFETFVKKNPPDFSSRVAFFVWAWRAHNHVNVETKKPQMSLQDAYAIHHWEKE